MPLAAGTRLGPYEIVAPIGAGGMGEVYRALDPRLRREVALKILPQQVRQDGSLRARFEQEARAASTLNHSNIVSIYDIGEQNDVLYMVTELVDGESLRKLIARGPMPVRKLIEIGQQIADGLAAMHSAGIMHRDLKPENILIKPNGQVKIIDFGLAKQLALPALAGADLTQTLTAPGLIMGTIGYMSPEQIRAQPADARADIFSLGVVLYEMAAGKNAFTGASSADVMSAILNQEPPELKNAEIPLGLGLIIRRCLEKDAAQRFQSASDLAFAIRNLSAASTSPAPAPKAETEPRTRRVVWPAWAALGLCIAAGAFYWIQHKASEPSGPREASVTPAPPSTPHVSGAPSSQPVVPRTQRPKRVVAESVAEPAPKQVASEEPSKPAPDPASISAPATPPVTDPRAGELLTRGQQLNRDGQYASAVEAFGEAIRRKPDYAAAYLGRANAHFFLEQYDQAIDDYTEALQLQPGLAVAHDARGRTFARQRQFDRALADYNEAIRLKPDLSVPYVDRGVLYNQQGDYQKALQDFDQAIRLKADLPNAYAGRAVAKQRLGDKQGAAEDRKQAAQLKSAK